MLTSLDCTPSTAPSELGSVPLLLKEVDFMALITFLSVAPSDQRTPSAEARERLAKADRVVRDVGSMADGLVSEAREGKVVVRERSEEWGALLADDGEIATVLRAGVDVELLAADDGRPLFRKRVLVTRAKEQAGATAALLRGRGARVVVSPTIEIVACDTAPLRRALDQMGAYDWVAFTSANGVLQTFRELHAMSKDSRALSGVKVASIGPATALALEAHGIRADLVARESRGEGFAEQLLSSSAPGRLLLARAKEAREVFPQMLRQSGWTVDVVAAYETRRAGRDEAVCRSLEAGELDAVMVTSTSTAVGLCELVGERAPELLLRTCVASIGPVTTEALVVRGVRVDVSPSQYTVPALVSALERFFG